MSEFVPKIVYDWHVESAYSACKIVKRYGADPVEVWFDEDNSPYLHFSIAYESLFNVLRALSKKFDIYSVELKNMNSGEYTTVQVNLL